MSLPTDTVRRDLLPESILDIRDPVPHLEHASICDDCNCGSNACRIIKTSEQHFINCLDGFCDHCENFFNLTARHAMHCEREPCPTILCNEIKYFLRYMSLCVGSGDHFLKGRQKHFNLGEKLVCYIRRRELSIKRNSECYPTSLHFQIVCINTACLVHPEMSSKTRVIQNSEASDLRNKALTTPFIQLSSKNVLKLPSVI
ncbi:hypothetical protein TNIN_9931 [Trichonephila inaurata madagascariensis]|uniref:TAZ-type domain-containing protein n=1 Tax=Trichonephila inaurata madagascariensis TaxID=2747483 RepID=A0A8X6XGP7_9ARAC|nr:hypothetical protein TNIN_9931 [Trichonephila inaurata madagascariensis]